MQVRPIVTHHLPSVGLNSSDIICNKNTRFMYQFFDSLRVDDVHPVVNDKASFPGCT